MVEVPQHYTVGQVVINKGLKGNKLLFMPAFGDISEAQMGVGP